MHYVILKCVVIRYYSNRPYPTGFIAVKFCLHSCFHSFFVEMQYVLFQKILYAMLFKAFRRVSIRNTKGMYSKEYWQHLFSSDVCSLKMLIHGYKFRQLTVAKTPVSLFLRWRAHSSAYIRNYSVARVEQRCLRVSALLLLVVQYCGASCLKADIDWPSWPLILPCGRNKMFAAFLWNMRCEEDI